MVIKLILSEGFLLVMLVVFGQPADTLPQLLDKRHQRSLLWALIHRSSISQNKKCLP